MEIFKACADGTRLRILFLLAKRELCVCELVEVLEMPQGKISRHLAMLKRAELVRDRREGTWIYYSLAQGDTVIKQYVEQYLATEGNRLPASQTDLKRLRELAAQGAICAASS